MDYEHELGAFQGRPALCVASIILRYVITWSYLINFLILADRLRIPFHELGTRYTFFEFEPQAAIATKKTHLCTHREIQIGRVSDCDATINRSVVWKVLNELYGGLHDLREARIHVFTAYMWGPELLDGTE